MVFAAAVIIRIPIDYAMPSDCPKYVIIIINIFQLWYTTTQHLEQYRGIPGISSIF